MKSIKMKLIVSILICSLLTAVLIGVLAITNSMKTAGNDAVAKMQLTGLKKAGEINSVIQKIEQSIDTMSEVAMQYSYQGTKKQLLYNNLDNGMKFVLTAPEDEIYGAAYSLVRMILAAIRQIRCMR